MKDKDSHLLEEMYAKRFVKEAIRPNGNRNQRQVSPTSATTNPSTVQPNNSVAAAGQAGQNPPNPSASSAQQSPQTPETQVQQQAQPANPNTQVQQQAVDPSVETDPNSNYNQLIAGIEAGDDISTWMTNPMTGQQISPEEVQQVLAQYQQGQQVR